MRRIVIRETDVSRYLGGFIEGPPDIFRTSQHYRFEEFKGSNISFFFQSDLLVRSESTSDQTNRYNIDITDINFILIQNYINKS